MTNPFDFTRTPAWTRSARILALAAALWAMLYYGLLQWLALPNGFVLGLLADVPLIAAAAIAAWAAGRRYPKSSRDHSGWRALGWAFVFQLIGELVYTVLVAGYQRSGFPSLADVFYLGFYPAALFGLLRFTERLETIAERLKFTLDAAIILIGVGAGTWYFLVRPIAVGQDSEPWVSVLASFYPTADAVLLFAAVTVLLGRPGRAAAACHRWWVASFAVLLLSDSRFVYLSLLSTYDPAHWFDACWAIAYLMALAAALAAPESARAEVVAAAGRPAAADPFAILSYLAVGSGYAFLAGYSLARWPPPLGGLALAAGSLTMLVLLRQIIALRENARLLAGRAARLQEQRFHSLVQHSSDLITIVDPDGTLRFLSPSVERILGRTGEALLHQRLELLAHPEDRPRLRAFLAELERRPGASAPVEWRLQHHDGRWLQVEVVGTNLLADPRVGGLVLNTRDVTERNALAEQLSHQAFHDSLTGLANRALLRDRAAHALVQVRRQGGAVEVLLIDLDDFKRVNDSLGHAAGDALLVAVVERLRGCVRSSDTVARLGGDEFAVLLEGVRGADPALELAGRILHALEPPFELAGRRVAVGASIGVAAAGGDSVDELLRQADIAMYAAKAAGKGRAQRFEPRMQAQVQERLELESELRAALEGQQLRLSYQPVVDLTSGRLAGAEALLRWPRAPGEHIEMSRVVALAEETGLIVPLGRWVLRESCRQARAWRSLLQASEPAPIAINISGRQLEESDLVEDVRAALREFELAPGAILLELTESVIMRQPALALDRLTALRRLGVKIAVDDFGTGHSSLTALQRFPIDWLKIGQGFVGELAASAAQAALVRGIVSLALALHLTTVAEGIETRQQADRLVELGCRLGQGFFFSRPLDPEAFHAWSTSGRRQSPAHRSA